MYDSIYIKYPIGASILVVVSDLIQEDGMGKKCLMGTRFLLGVMRKF